MLYKKNSDIELEHELFKSPTSEYRGAPFWAWNCKLEEQELLWQIEILKEMGLGGFHMHSRTGMATKYLSDEFMSLIKACQQKAVKEDMLCWLYDEDRWPSGAAGGYVTKNKEYRARHITFIPYPIGEDEDTCLIGCYAVSLKDGYLEKYERIRQTEAVNEDSYKEKGYDIWYLYMELDKESPWYNNQTYVDTLNEKAISEFIKITYDRYYEQLGEAFGESVPAIFTDEPQFTRKKALMRADDRNAVALPFTDDFPDTYKMAYGEDILDFIPELVWELSEGKISAPRYRYHDHICERFTRAFADNVGNWCEKHNIMLTGHMMEEQTLLSQTAALGEAMRSYRSFQLPGIDMLCDRREFNTAKQAQSAARQYGRPGVLSELYGVTNWDFDFKGHKLQGDWQAALGVTVRVHHLAWVSMEGESKRDYPASMNYHSTWYKEYPLIENYFARINTALTRGKAKVSVGVIHPVESYWLYWGPMEQTFDKRKDLEERFDSFAEWMLLGLIDFDYISEALFPELCQNVSYPLAVGECRYDTIIVPGCVTLRSSTAQRLNEFKKSGGRVIFMGEPPKYIDAVPGDITKIITEHCECIPFTELALMDAMKEDRIIDIRNNNGIRTGNLIHQMRTDGKDMWLFICNVYGKKNNLDIPEQIRISVKGRWNAELYETMDGSVKKKKTVLRGDYTDIDFEIYAHDSILLKLSSYEACLDGDLDNTETECSLKSVKSIIIKQPDSYTLSEKNVFLLDMAEYSIDGAEYQEEEEILRIDKTVREKLGLPKRTLRMAQPWVTKSSSDPAHSLKLRYRFDSEVTVPGCMLAMEKPNEFEIFLNGEPVQVILDKNEYFIDKSIKTFTIPDIIKGTNEIVLIRKFYNAADIEYIYILGDFGAAVFGRHKIITEKPDKLRFGDITRQGFPFYAGDVTYSFNISMDSDAEAILETPRFYSPVLSIYVDGKKCGNIAFAPHRLNLGVLGKGNHIVEIKMYGSRINTLGQLHNTNAAYHWWGADSWRTNGTDWSYEYNLRTVGVIQSPVLYLKH